jgi:hypothetical protein
VVLGQQEFLGFVHADPGDEFVRSFTECLGEQSIEMKRGKQAWLAAFSRVIVSR